MLPTTKTIELAESLGFLKEKRSDWEKSRASLTDIQDWLRDNYRIHCSVNPWEENKGSKVVIYEGNIIDVDDDWDVMTIGSFFSDHYKALESCILFALKILKDRYGKETKK